jgi:transcriptional regulator with XRE-family HTH domain
MAETPKTHPETTNAYPSGLAQWLADNAITRHQLATELGVSPHAIDHLANGSTGTVTKAILRAVATRTSLTYEQILDPVDAYVSPVATGDHRIDRCLAKLAKYLHSENMFEECKSYIHPEFSCYGTIYCNDGAAPIDFETMCNRNLHQETVENVQIVHTILSTTWYTPHGIDPHDSRILHSYWRALTLIKEEMPLYNDTFTVYEFAKPINEMSPVETPKIVSWWWDQPSQYNRAPMEAYPSDVMAAIAVYKKNTGGGRA